mmetsp:Transcript_34315/g.94596  ORF Transcript_34315/g.94596 Transcript_34315/m.94596 type:complete len:225 (-) Transcript_34315:156-830(-)
MSSRWRARIFEVRNSVCSQISSSASGRDDFFTFFSRSPMASMCCFCSAMRDRAASSILASSPPSHCTSASLARADPTRPRRQDPSRRPARASCARASRRSSWASWDSARPRLALCSIANSSCLARRPAATPPAAPPFRCFFWGAAPSAVSSPVATSARASTPFERFVIFRVPPTPRPRCCSGSWGSLSRSPDRSRWSSCSAAGTSSLTAPAPAAWAAGSTSTSV